MNKKLNSLRSPLGKVRGLGSAHNGTHHWWMQRVTAMMMIPLIIIIGLVFINHVVFGSYSQAFVMLHSPIMAVFMIIFLGLGYYHGTNGLQVVIEDYIHCPCKKNIALLSVRIISLMFAALGILAIIQIYLKD